LEHDEHVVTSVGHVGITERGNLAFLRVMKISELYEGLNLIAREGSRHI
jgi:hypothetical protein